MENHNKLFNVRMLEEYVFCPMMFYYKYVLGIRNPPNLWSVVGNKVQEELSHYVEENYEVIAKQAYLESRRYGLTGIVDYIVKYQDTPTPLEIKYSKRMKPWWKYTLVAYALLIEENYDKPVKTAILVIPGPRTIIINITDSDRKHILKTLENMKKTIEGTKQPKPTPSKTCTNCDYRNICPYKNKTN